uniref:Uncharacterized protein n=1 Tax=Populus trichocarpa TaxID=3694 RepID=A9PC32_POPTR|nr:unknown [Populus trichocarpa]
MHGVMIDGKNGCSFMICNAKVMVSSICVLLTHVHDINFYHLLGN